MKYPGQSWQNEMIRANLAQADRDRQAEARRHATPTVRQAPPPAEPAPEAPRRTWRDMSPDELHRF